MEAQLNERLALVQLSQALGGRGAIATSRLMKGMVFLSILLAIFAAWDLSLRSRAFRPLLDYLFIEADGLFGDRGPTEGPFYAPPSGISETLAPLRILIESIDLEGEIPRKLFGIGGKTCDRILIEGN